MLFVGKCEEWSEKLDFNRALPTPDKKFCFGQGLPQSFPWKFPNILRILFLNKKGLIGDLYVHAYMREEQEDENCNATLIDEEFFRIAKLVNGVLQKIISDIYGTCYQNSNYQ